MAHINFAPFPDVEARPTPPPDYQNIQTNPREFGAQVGAGEEQLGAGLTRAGELYGQISADDQANHVLEGLDSLNTQLRGLQGKERMDAYPGVQKQMQDLLTSARGNLSTTQETLDFDRQTRYLYSRSLREAGDLYDQATKEWGVGVNKAGADLSLNGVQRAAADNDSAALANHTQDLVNWRIKQAQLQFGNDLSPQMREDIVRGAHADATKTAVESLITTDPVRAQQLLDAGRDNLLGNDYEAMSQRLKQPLIDHQAQQLVFGSARAGGGAPTVTPAQVAQAAQANGVDPALANATAAIESGHGANVGSGEHAAVRGNVFQMGPEERTAAGGSAGSMGTPDQQVDQGVKFLAQKRDDLTTLLDRPPTNAEIYLAHQQGSKGAAALIKAANDPNNSIPAGDIVGAAAIRDNGGDPAAPASAFVHLWQQRYQQAEQQYSTGAPPYPYPAGRLQQIMASDASPEAKQKAAQELELQWSVQNHEYEAHQRQLTQASDVREKEIIADVYSDQPKVTLRDVSTDPTLKPDAQQRMLKFVAAGPDPKVSPAASERTSMNLLDDMRKPAGDPARIADMGPIIDAYTQGKLTRSDFTFLQTQLGQTRSADGERLADVEREFLKGMQSSITKSNPLQGQLDHSGDRQFFRFQQDMYASVARYQHEGKNPFDLFNPYKPDYLGNAKAIQPYTVPIEQAEKATAGNITAAPAAAAAPAAPAMPQRQPGESVVDYIKRTGISFVPPATGPAVAPPIAR